jgi:cation transport ATPase
MSSAALSGEVPSGPGESSGLRKVEFLVHGMICAACGAKVENKLNAIENVPARVNYATEKATATVPALVPVQLLTDTIEQAGYGAEVAAADLGLAIGSGTDVAICAADLILLRDDLGAVADGIRLARATLATIRRNLAWAFGCNIAAVPLAAAGFLNPLIAGAAMAVSSAFVVGNSVRLRRFGAPAPAGPGRGRQRPAGPGRHEHSGGGADLEEQVASCPG